MRFTRAYINLGALKNNLTTLQQSLVNPQKTGLIAVVKANAYGHGLVEIAKAALEWGVSHLAVAIAEEGRMLRQAKIQAPIIVLGLIPPEDALVCVENKLIVTVSETSHLLPLKLAAKKTGQQALTMIKVDTGMNRIGTDNEGAIKLAKEITAAAELVHYGIFTHFASAGGPDFNYAKVQEAQFRQLINNLEELKLRPQFVTASASSALTTMPASQYDLVRAGISMYGLYPSTYLQARQKLEPILKLATRIAYLKKVAAGTPIGYEMTYTTQNEALIATLPLGYGDGYSRRLSNKARVLLNGQFQQVCGNICMDQTMIILDANTKTKVGEEVVLIGSQGKEKITLEELAALAGTINYELACNLSQRVPRIYLN